MKAQAHWPRLPSTMAGERLVTLPDDWTVWTFSDCHGVTSGLVAALREAGLIDARLEWCAPPHTGLIGCGDYLDRGADSQGTLVLLRRLEGEAAAAGGRAIFCRGNHEEMMLHLHAGRGEWLEVWLAYGGHATLQSFGVAPRDPRRDGAGLRALAIDAPWLFMWLATMPQAVRWRDVLLVHAGMAPDVGLDDLGITTDAHLWVRHEFFQAPWGGPEFVAYRAAGIERVVFGHTPGPDGLRTFHGGRSVGIDTNAPGNPGMPPNARRLVTVLRLGDGGFDGPLDAVVVPTDDAPDRALNPDPRDPMLDYRGT